MTTSLIRDVLLRFGFAAKKKRIHATRHGGGLVCVCACACVGRRPRHRRRRRHAGIYRIASQMDGRVGRRTERKLA